MPEQYDQIEYYGKGPHENYIDRNNSAMIGLYNQSVSEQYYPYIRPQDLVTRPKFATGKL